MRFIGYNSQQIGGIHGGGQRAYITLLWLAGSILFNVTLLFYVFREHQFYKWCVLHSRLFAFLLFTCHENVPIAGSSVNLLVSK